MSSDKTEPLTTSDSFVSTYSYLTEQEKQMNEDYEWCLHDAEGRRQYGEQVVAVHQRHIWAAGANHLAALQQPGCPPRKALVFVVVPPLMRQAVTK